MIPKYDLIIDSREQKPLGFKKNVVFKGLKAGDYGAKINGVLLPVVFDRKNPSDAMSTLVQGHERFQRELGTAYQNGLKIIMIVECSYTDFITKKFYGGHHSKIRPDVLKKILHSTMISHDLQIIFCNNRQEMTAYIRNYFNALAKYELKHNKEKYFPEKKEKRE
jgi:ERCC4-type nuclease